MNATKLSRKALSEGVLKDTGLCYNRHRYYDPETVRYISEDPIGLLGGLVLHGYVGDTLGWIDPFGLACKRPIKAFEVAPYGSFGWRSVKDGLDGHELLQNAWLKAHGFIMKRSLGIASRHNPAMALPAPLHKLVNRAQRGADLLSETVLGNIGRNARILLDHGVPRKQVYKATNKAIAHAKKIGAL